jgi:hypothetical protein
MKRGLRLSGMWSHLLWQMFRPIHPPNYIPSYSRACNCYDQRFLKIRQWCHVIWTKIINRKVYSKQKASPRHKPIGSIKTDTEFSIYVHLKIKLFRLFFSTRKNVILNSLMTDSLKESPYWEAECRSACPQIPRLLWNPKVHYFRTKPPFEIVKSRPPPHVLLI